MGDIKLSGLERIKPQVTNEDFSPDVSSIEQYVYKDLKLDLSLGTVRGDLPANKAKNTTDIEDHRDLDAIVVAGINGITAGGGCEFSLGCDLRIMSDGDYKIGLPETSVGILPGGGGTQRLARLIGASRALDLILHARLLTPHEAESFGIINKIIPHKNFHEGLNHYCQDIANRAPIALSQVKKIIEGTLNQNKAKNIWILSKVN